MLYQNSDDTLLRWVDRCDGIILAGGVDIHPSVYDNSIWNNQGFSKFDLKRDIRELKVIKRCQETGKPLFGICRGHQLIGITYGFFLIPDLSGSVICHQPQRQQITLEKHEPMHKLELTDPDEYFSLFSGRNPAERRELHKIMGFKQNTHLWTNSFHHQGLAFPASKKRWPSRAEDVKVYAIGLVGLSGIKVDNIIELMGGETWVSAQFHPEYDWKVNSASRAVLERFQMLLHKDKRSSLPLLIEEIQMDTQKVE
jgi:gamma-glutamyl-gamma-aminobutyrate hydrolase PuuD